MITQEDNKHLDLLAIFHYVLGGISVFFACIPLIHLSIGVLMLFGKMPMEQDSEGFDAIGGWMFAIMGGLFFVFGQVVAWLIVYSGTQIKKRKKRLFSFVMACIICSFVPFGTALGVFTIILLNKESVKDAYLSK